MAASWILSSSQSQQTGAWLGKPPVEIAGCKSELPLNTIEGRLENPSLLRNHCLL